MEFFNNENQKIIPINEYITICSNKYKLYEKLIIDPNYICRNTDIIESEKECFCNFCDCDCVYETYNVLVFDLCIKYKTLTEELIFNVYKINKNIPWSYLLIRLPFSINAIKILIANNVMIPWSDITSGGVYKLSYEFIKEFHSYFDWNKIPIYNDNIIKNAHNLFKEGVIPLSFMIRSKLLK